jgi:hypothetical protein
MDARMTDHMAQEFGLKLEQPTLLDVQFESCTPQTRKNHTQIPQLLHKGFGMHNKIIDEGNQLIARHASKDLVNKSQAGTWTICETIRTNTKLVETILYTERALVTRRRL